MAKAQPVMTINIDITKKYLDDLTSVLTDFNSKLIHSIKEQDIKAAGVTVKDMRARLAADPKLLKQIRVAIEHAVDERLGEIISDPFYWNVGENIEYLDKAYGEVDLAAEKREENGKKARQAQTIADNIKDAVELLKQAGYKIVE